MQVFEYSEMIFMFGLLALGLHWIAKTKGFYLNLSSRGIEKIPVKFTSVAIVFIIYLVMTLGISSLFAQIIRSLYAFANSSPSYAAMGWLQLGIILATLALFYLYSRTLPPSIIGKILKNRSLQHSSIPWDMMLGVITWIISFPLVLAVGQLVDMILYLTAGFETYEQVAVRYLKTAVSTPETLTVALFTILIGAPAIEEFLFRGFLQTYFKRWMPIRWAISLSSLCFALFHLSASQGIGNISLVISLFTFALYLGYIYERQASLFASFTLHATFNAVSTARILFFSDSA